MCTSFVLTHCPLLRLLKIFPEGAVVRCVCSTTEPVLAVVKVLLPMVNSTEASCTNVVPLVHDYTSVERLTAVRATSPPPYPTEAPVQPAEVLPPKGVRHLQSTLHAFFQPRVLFPKDPEDTDAIPLAGNLPPGYGPPPPTVATHTQGLRSGHPTSGLGHTFGDKLYFTRDIPQEKWIPKKLEAPPVAKPAPKCRKQPAAKPAAASSSIPVADGEHVQLS